MPRTTEAQVIGKQLLRSGTSVGARYRESVRARSDGEFISKLGLSLQEPEESAYWIELLIEAGIMAEARLADPADEAHQLAAILVTCVMKAKRRRDGR